MRGHAAARHIASGTRLLDAFDRDQTLLATTRAALGGDGLMPNTTTAPPLPHPRRGHSGLRRSSATGQAAAVRGGGGD